MKGLCRIARVYAHILRVGLSGSEILPLLILEIKCVSSANAASHAEILVRRGVHKLMYGSKGMTNGAAASR